MSRRGSASRSPHPGARSRPVGAGFWLFALAVALCPASPGSHAAAQSSSATTVSASVTPASAWVGDEVVLRAVVTTAGRDLHDIRFDPPPSLEIVDVDDRESSSAGTGGRSQLVYERSWRLRLLEAGTLTLPPVEVQVGGATFRSASSTVEAVAAPLTWQRPRAGGRPRDPAAGAGVVPQGVPVTGSPGPALPLPVPDAARGSTGALPPGTLPPSVVPPAGTLPGGATYPGAGVYGGPPVAGGATAGLYGGTEYGRGSVVVPAAGATPGGWAATATSDPWWPELVPELFAYQTEAADPAGLVRLAAGVTPERVYVGQQLTYVATVFLGPRGQLRLRYPPRYVPPPPGAFTAVELVEPGARGLAAFEGDVEVGVTFRRALFGASPGVHVIPPASVVYSGSSAPRRGARADSLAVDAMRVQVLDLPSADVPPAFRGAVGRYRIEAGVSPRQVVLGQTAALQVRVVGAGYVPAVPAPDLGSVFGMEVVPGAERTLLEVADGVVGGVKVFTWLLLPHEPGLHRIGPILFAYFDPHLAAYAQVAVDELLIEVLPVP